MKKNNLKSFKIDDNFEKVTVCAWCFPTDTIFNIFPHLKGKVAISHGICGDHAFIIKSDIENRAVGLLKDLKDLNNN